MKKKESSDKGKTKSQKEKPKADDEKESLGQLMEKINSESSAFKKLLKALKEKKL